MTQRDIVEAWLANKGLERLADYLQRGRPLAGVPLEELRERWVALMRAWARRAPGREPDSEREDIEAEMKVRRVEPPFDLAQDAVDALIEKSRKTTAELLKNPERYGEAERQLSAEIADFEASTKQRKN